MLHSIALRGRRLSTLSLSIALASAVSLPLYAAENTSAKVQQSYRFDIPAQSLDGALAAFSAVTRIQVLVSGELTRGLRSPGLAGSYSQTAALSALLAGTGLSASFVNADTVTLDKPLELGSAMELGATTVSGQGLGSVTEGSGSYTTAVTKSATRLALSPRETPQTITVVTRQKMDDFGLTDMDDVLESTSSVYVRENSLSSSSKYYSRGFTLQSQYDGANHPIDITAYEASPDSAFLDHVEILQGASGLLSGAGQPGGTVNMIRKLPTAQAQASVEVGAGSWDNKRLVGDVSGPLVASGTLRGRAVALWQEGNSFVDYEQERKQGFYGVLEADLTPTTLLTGRVQYQKNKITPGYGVPMAADGSDLGFSRSRFFATDWSRMDKESWLYTLGLEQQLGSGWTLHASYDHSEAERNSLYGNFWGSASLTNIALVRDEGRYTSDSVDVYASGSFELLGRSHELVVGANTSEARTKSLNVRRTVAADIYTFDPDSIPRYDGVLGNWLPFDERSQDGLYLATRLSLADSLKLILGTRVSDYRYETSAGKATLKENGVVSPYAGLIYDLNDWSSVYLSYSDIFNPQSYKDASGNTLKPVVGSNYEAGIKGEFYEGRLNTAIAVFRLEQENLGKQDTYDLDACDGWCYIAAGLVISQGVDLSVNGEVLPGWQVSAGYTYVESKYGKGTQTGDPYASYLPEQILRASTSYALPGTDWTVGGDVRVQSEVYSEGTTGGTAYKVDQGGLALVGLMAKYRITDKADIGLRVANLFDRTYYERIGYPAYANFYGEPRNFNVTFRQAF